MFLSKSQNTNDKLIVPERRILWHSLRSYLCKYNQVLLMYTLVLLNFRKWDRIPCILGFRLFHIPKLWKIHMIKYEIINEIVDRLVEIIIFILTTKIKGCHTFSSSISHKTLWANTWRCCESTRRSSKICTCRLTKSWFCVRSTLQSLREKSYL